MSALLDVEAVTIRIGGLTALSELSFAVQPGEILSLIGPNGAGKTTAFNAITGYMRPRQGSIRFAGTDITGAAPERIAGLGLVRSFQRTAIFGECSVADNMLMALHLGGREGLLGALLRTPAQRREEQRLRAEAMALLDLVGLVERGATLAASLAYGEQRRLGIALAAAAAPKLLLLDEPAAGLNPSETVACMDLIRQLRDRGTTILLVEHDMAMVMNLSDRILVLNQGRLIAQGAPDEVRRNPEVIRAYLGTGATSHAAA